MKKFILYITLILLCLTVSPVGVFALTASQVRDQIKETNDQIVSIEKEIAILSKQIAKTGEEKDSLAKALKELNLTKTQLLKEKEAIQKKINNTGLIIKNISSDISEKENSINLSREVLANLIRRLYINDNELLIERILSEENFTDFSRKYNDILSLNEKIREHINFISGKKEELVVSKTEKEKEQENLNGLKRNLTQKEQVVAINQQEKNTLLKETQNKESNYQKLLAEQIKRKESFEREMTEYETQLKLLINPKFLPKEGSEVLSWPFKSIFITSPFGIRVNPFNSSINTFHYGVDFRAISGTPVLAMAGGVVEGTGNTDVACQGASFGRWILIKHTNGLSSVYGHLSAISVEKGDVIKTGDTIGLSGGTRGVFGSGSSTGPHLHVSVYASDGVEVASFESKGCPGKILVQPRITRTDAHLDPMLYLPKVTPDMIKK